MADSLKDLVSKRQDDMVIEGDDLAKGFSMMPHVMSRDKKLSDGAIVIYALLLSYAHQSGSAFPGQETLAEWRGKSVRQIQRYLYELQQAGWIYIERRGLNKTNLYHIFTSRDRFGMLMEKLKKKR
jgi:hypothetical protein